MPYSIEIEGFKSIKHAKLELGNLNILIGANGAGKSNLIQVFGLLADLVDGRLQSSILRSGGAQSLLRYGPEETEQIRLRFQENQNAYEAKLGYSQDDSLFFEEEKCFFYGNGLDRFPFEVLLGNGHVETGLAQEAQRNPGKTAAHVLSRLRAWHVYHFHDTGDKSAIKRSCELNDNRALRSNASNLPALLYRLQSEHPDAYKRIVGAIKQVTPFFKDFDLRPDPIAVGNKIYLEWKEKGSDMYFNARSLSDGTIRYMCLATLLLQPTLPSVVVIDEPELGLHPYAVGQLAALLKSAASRTCIVVATQSVTLMNQFTPEDVIVVGRGHDGTEFKRVSMQEIATWADDYSLGEIWEKNILGGRPVRG